MQIQRTTRVLSYVMIGFALAACQPVTANRDGNSSGRRLISADDIARSSATNVWDLLRERVHDYDYREDRNGLPLTIKTRRGASSVYLVDAGSPILIIDGARIDDYRYLREIPTNSVDRIELLSGISGTATQGTNAGAGVIYIHTKSASDEVP